MRTELYNYLNSALTGTIKVSAELPWIQGSQPLYLKNMKRVYLDAEEQNEKTLIPTLCGTDVIESVKIVRAYLAVDAKNTPTTLSSAINTLLEAKNQVGIANHGSECDYTTDIQEDVIVYTFEYRLYTIT